MYWKKQNSLCTLMQSRQWETFLLSYYHVLHGPWFLYYMATHNMHEWKRGFFGERNQSCECSQSNQMPYTDQITKIALTYAPISELPYANMHVQTIRLLDCPVIIVLLALIADFFRTRGMLQLHRRWICCHGKSSRNDITRSSSGYRWYVII